MKATGIVRKIDDLGRIVIPKEIRRTLRLSEGTPLEIFTDREGEIILKKYSPMAELGIFAKQYAEALSQVSGHMVCVCDRDQIIAASGAGKKDLLGKPVSKELEQLVVGREVSISGRDGRKPIPMVEDDEGYTEQIIYPILSDGDVIGAVGILSREPKAGFSETEQKLCYVAAGFLGRQMES